MAETQTGAGLTPFNEQLARDLKIIERLQAEADLRAIELFLGPPQLVRVLKDED